MTNIHNHKILILDFGSQYTQLIARRVREIGVYCELWAWDVTEQQIREFAPTGIILSGGPESTTEENSPRAPKYVFNAGVPVLGVCYGMQTMAMQLGGLTETSEHREFGYASVSLENSTALFANLNDNLTANEPTLDVWIMVIKSLVYLKTSKLLGLLQPVQLQQCLMKAVISTAYNSTLK